MICPNCRKETFVHLWQDENSYFCSYCFHVWNASQQTEIERLKQENEILKHRPVRCAICGHDIDIHGECSLCKEIDQLKARLAQYERESAEENTCELHPKTTMFYGCLECNKTLKAQVLYEQERNQANVAIAEERLKDCEVALLGYKDLYEAVWGPATAYFTKWSGK
jgi:hypothetical protein